MTSTQIFVANWINQFFTERGFIGSVDPHELEPERISDGLDRFALDDLRIALIYLRTDWKARKGHNLAGTLVRAIERDIRRIEATEFRGYVKKRPNRKSEQFSAIA